MQFSSVDFRTALPSCAARRSRPAKAHCHSHMFKTAAQLQAGAASALKGIDTMKSQERERRSQGPGSESAAQETAGQHAGSGAQGRRHQQVRHQDDQSVGVRRKTARRLSLSPPSPPCLADLEMSLPCYIIFVFF